MNVWLIIIIIASNRFLTILAKVRSLIVKMHTQRLSLLSTLLGRRTCITPMPMRHILSLGTDGAPYQLPGLRINGNNCLHYMNGKTKTKNELQKDLK